MLPHGKSCATLQSMLTDSLRFKLAPLFPFHKDSINRSFLPYPHPILDTNGYPPDNNYIFLGDYVDRGRQNIETIGIIFCYKIKYPENFFMLRGNHECPAINRVYGFYEECNRRYKSTKLWASFQDTFNCVPLCGLIGGRIFCMHGGLFPLLTSLDQLRQLPRPQDPPNPLMSIDLLWANPING